MEKSAMALKRRRLGRLKRKERFIDFLYGVPAMVLIALFVYYPVAYLFRISFTNWDFMSHNISFVGMKNYKWLFTGNGWPKFCSSLRITFTYMLGEVAIVLVLGITLAVLFNRMGRFFTVLRTIVIIPKYISIASTAMIFLWLMQRNYGLFNRTLTALGLSPADWLGSADTALGSILFMSGWRIVGYAMMIYLSAMKGISRDYLEAASIDGADGFKSFWYITLPLLSPTTMFLVVTTFLGGMKVYNSIDLMTSGGPFESTNAIVYWIYKLAFVDFKAARAASVSVVFFIILLLLTALTVKWSNKKVNYDA